MKLDFQHVPCNMDRDKLTASLLVSIPSKSPAQTTGDQGLVPVFGFWELGTTFLMIKQPAFRVVRAKFSRATLHPSNSALGR